MIENYGYSDWGIWQAFSWRWNGASLLLQRRQLLMFIANDNILAFMWKLKFWGTCIHTSILEEDFSDDIDGDSNEWTFFYFM